MEENLGEERELLREMEATLKQRLEQQKRREQEKHSRELQVSYFFQEMAQSESTDVRN